MNVSGIISGDGIFLNTAISYDTSREELML